MSNIEASTPMPQYQSHKKVWALKIEKVHENAYDDGVTLIFVDKTFANRSFTLEELKGRPEPDPGWYMVQYEDGYISFSPADVFEDGYTRI
jgi:hypothetical protein